MKITGSIVRALCCAAHALRRDREGQDLVEYALMAGFIVAGVITLAPEIAESFVTVMSKVNSVMIAAGSA